MINHNFEKRLTGTKLFYGYLSDLIANFSEIKKATTEPKFVVKLSGFVDAVEVK